MGVGIRSPSAQQSARLPAIPEEKIPMINEPSFKGLYFLLNFITVYFCTIA